MNPIAIVTDSGTDVPEALCHRWDIHVLPLLVQYEAMTCRDRVDITVQQVLDRLDLEIPKTSMPTLGDAVALLESLRDQGYKQALAVTISSGLSGTCQMLRLAAEDIEGMDVRVVDSRSIGIGAGALVIRAAELAAQGMGLDALEQSVEAMTRNIHVFFTMETLQYLQEGGRIGKMSAAVGNLLSVRPVITCNKEGVLQTVQKVRGNSAALEAAVSQTVKAVGNQKRFRLFVAHADAAKRARTAAEILKTRLPNAEEILLAEIGPALAVHSGPGLLGVGVQLL